MFSILIIGVFALVGLAKWLLTPERERVLHEPLSPEERELFGAYFDLEDDAPDYQEMRKSNPHIWMEEEELEG